MRISIAFLESGHHRMADLTRVPDPQTWSCRVPGGPGTHLT